MKIKIILLAALLSVCSFSQEQKFADLGDLKLISGEIIKNCRIGYRTAGVLNESKTNVIVYPTWFGGKSESIINVSGRLLDTTKYFIIAVDALGDGVSSSPSNSPEQRDSLFPEITIKDMVNSQYELLTRIMGLNHIHGIIGGSMGGMQVFQWVVSFPDYMNKAIAYVGTPQLTSFDLMLWRAEILAIEQWEENGGDRVALAEVISTIHNLLITTPEQKNQKVDRNSFEKYLEDLHTGFRKSFEPYNWKRQLSAMCAHDISVDGSLQAAAERIDTDFFIIIGSEDLIVNPVPASEFADKYKFRKYVFGNNCGHLAPGCEFEVFAGLVKSFFEENTLN